MGWRGIRGGGGGGTRLAQKTGMYGKMKEKIDRWIDR